MPIDFNLYSFLSVFSIVLLSFITISVFYISFIEFCSSNNLDFKNIKIEEFLSIITSQPFNKSKKISNNEIKNFIELYFYKKLYLNKNKKVYDLISYFNKKFSDLESFNLDLESYFIEFRHKLLNE